MRYLNGVFRALNDHHTTREAGFSVRNRTGALDYPLPVLRTLADCALRDRQEYRRFAAVCLELAQRAPGSEETLRLLEMAQRWVLLAQRAACAEMPKSQHLKEECQSRENDD
jgi:hypothetical protein